MIFSPFGDQKWTQIDEKTSLKKHCFSLSFLEHFFNDFGAILAQKITRFSRNGAPKASFEAASLWECILDRFGGLWGSILLDF